MMARMFLQVLQQVIVRWWLYDGQTIPLAAAAGLC